jgi:carnitine O-acetyltransferase
MIGVATRDEKVRLLREAVKKHTRLASEAIIGEGVDRHMLGPLLTRSTSTSTNLSRSPGLRLSKPSSLPAPALFTDPLYTRSSHWTLSTSAIFSSHIGAYGWGEVVPDGFGVAYMTGFDGVPTSSSRFDKRSLTVDVLDQITYSTQSPLAPRCPTRNL